jgi:rhodanese-related sulfurtransferase
MKKFMLIIASLLIVLTLAACGGQDFTNISNDELREMMADKETDYYFIDVRTREEYDLEHIAGFNLVIDQYILEDDQSILDELDTSRPVVIMCNSGNRSVDASNIFLDYGFTEVYNLTNGIQGWDGETTAD